MSPPGNERTPAVGTTGATAEDCGGKSLTVIVTPAGSLHGYCAVVSTPAGTHRRRVFLSIDAAYRAVDRAHGRGQAATVAFYELRPL